MCSVHLFSGLVISENLVTYLNRSEYDVKIFFTVRVLNVGIMRDELSRLCHVCMDSLSLPPLYAELFCLLTADCELDLSWTFRKVRFLAAWPRSVHQENVISSMSPSRPGSGFALTKRRTPVRSFMLTFVLIALILARSGTK